MTNPIFTAVAMFAAAALLPLATACAEPLYPAPALAPFTATLSNNTPLAFGMTANGAAAALGTKLAYLRGRPGDEIYLALRDIGGSGFFPRQDRLFLQFRRGRLTAWKGDWGQNWMWQ